MNNYQIPFPFESRQIERKKNSIRDSLFSRSDLVERRIAILGGGATSGVIDFLEIFLLNEGIRPRFYVSQFDRYYEEIMFSNKELSQFQPELIFIFTSVRNLRLEQHAMTTEESKKLFLSTYEKFQEMWEKIRTVFQCRVIQNNFELPPYRFQGNQDAGNPTSMLSLVSFLNKKLQEYSQTNPDFFIHDLHYLAASEGLDRWFEPYSWYAWRYTFNPRSLPKVCHSAATLIKTIFTTGKKCLVLDLDNTIWGGVIGEDGIEGIELSPESPEGEGGQA